MPANPKRDGGGEHTPVAGEAVADALRGRVLRALGEPAGRYEVRVRRLWEDHYRANVFLVAGLTSGKIACSYFLVADADGNILASTPALARRYPSVSNSV
jgi:hypothetical protein